jgi:hypothetical protein
MDDIRYHSTPMPPTRGTALAAMTTHGLPGDAMQSIL